MIEEGVNMVGQRCGHDKGVNLVGQRCGHDRTRCEHGRTKVWT